MKMLLRTARCIVSIWVLVSSLAIAHAEGVSTSPWFGHIEGQFLHPSTWSGEYSNNASATSRLVGNGLGAEVGIGYRFDQAWDVAIGIRHANYKSGISPLFSGGADSYLHPRFLVVDLDLGHRLSNNLRAFAGFRYLSHKSEFTTVRVGNGYGSTDTYGIGPRLGFEYVTPLFGRTKLIAGLNASALFGEVENQANTAGTLIINRDISGWRLNRRGLGIC